MNPSPPSSPRGAVAHDPAVTPPSLPPSLPPFIHRRDDAKEAMENMHNAELYGRVIRCNYAKPQAIKGGEQGWSMQPVWADADKYQEEIAAGEEEEEEEGDDPMAALEASVD